MHIFIQYLLNYSVDFGKAFNSQHFLLAMVEKWCKTLSENGETGAILTDLSKAFDCINHNLLIDKLSACGVETQLIDFISFILTSLNVNKEQKLPLL